ncbi:hypothetical protein [Kaistella carnis]|uniref:hypothetical protein n=1 Tax=Kaistella carnis TaxID=1241979 RepID=UPI0028A91EF6|nr:hypothetical protein [Kaistella carnis]
MKNIFSILVLMISCMTFSQVIIGNQTGTATDKTSVLLEFAAGQNKGIILPYVRTLPTGATLAEGTILLDVTDSNAAKVKYYKGSSTWMDLSSGNGANVSSAMQIQPAAASENSSSKVIIGSTTSNVDGVLVLESTQKAMILPMVLSTADIPNPSPGMMVYINKPGAKRLAVFNGAVWTYWQK